VVRGVVHRTQLELLRRLRKADKPLEVCSVNCVTAASPKDQNELLEALSKVEIPPAQGGWRPPEDDLVCLEVAEYNPMQALMGIGDLPSETLLRHPAVRGGLLFPFASGIPVQVFGILRLIYDLRRFAVERTSQRKFKLRRFFSTVTPRLFFSIVRGEAEPTMQLVVTSQLLDAWYDSRPHVDNPKCYCGPRDYFHRHFSETSREMRKNYNDEKALAYSLWKTTTRFCDFVQATWENGLYGTAFDPVKFFGSEKDAEEFYNFIKRLDKAVDISQLLDKP
jgi:hypothetical protein